MRLFTPTDAQSQVRHQKVQQAIRDKQLTEAIDGKRAELARLEANFQELLFSQRARWAKEEMDYITDTETRRRELEKLEEAKRIALIPIEDLRKRTDTVYQEALQERAKALQMQTECEEESAALEERVDDLYELEGFLNKKKEDLARREEGLKLQEQTSSYRTRALSEAMDKFRVEHETVLMSLEDERERLRIWKMQLESTEQELQARKQGLENRERYLNDKYDTLLRTEKRIYGKRET